MEQALLFNPNDYPARLLHIPKTNSFKGLPYQGGKRLIADNLLQFMLARNMGKPIFWDIFGGGGSMSARAAEYGYEVYYNDYNNGISDLFQYCCKNKAPQKWLNWVERDEFFNHVRKHNINSTAITLLWSFGNTRGSFLYARQNCYIHKAFYKIIKNNDSKSRKVIKRLFPDLVITGKDADTRYSEINRYLDTLNRPKLTRTGEVFTRFNLMADLYGTRIKSFSSLSYEEVNINTPIDKTIVYCDPPYRGTAKYLNQSIDYDRFYKWFADLPYTAYMSEENAPFECVYKTEKMRTISANNNGLIRTEKLFWNGK